MSWRWAAFLRGMGRAFAIRGYAHGGRIAPPPPRTGTVAFLLDANDERQGRLCSEHGVPLTACHCPPPDATERPRRS